MIIAHNTTEGRVEVTFSSERHTSNDTITITKRTMTTPLTNSKTMWSKQSTVCEEMFTVERDLIPTLLAALGNALTLELGEFS